MINEIWKSIPGFPGYEVSKQGQVRSYRKQTGFSKWVIDQIPQRILKPSLAGRYLGVILRLDGKAYRKRIAELVLLAFVGPRPEGLEICHNDGDPHNNHLSNLRYDTHIANMNDAVIHGNICLDSRKLTNEQAKSIRLQYTSSNVTQRELAEKYSINRATIADIVTGKSYKEAGGPITDRKLTDMDVVSIRKQRARGDPLKEIANRFGVSRSCISLIARGKRR